MILLNFGMWHKYQDGSDAVFAIGSPTLELYMASYKAVTKETDSIDYSARAYGYELAETRYTLDVSKCHGIYGGTNYSFWLASPYVACEGMLCINTNMLMTGGSYNNGETGVKPVVGIPTSVFNAQYTLENDET